MSEIREKAKRVAEALGVPFEEFEHVAVECQGDPRLFNMLARGLQWTSEARGCKPWTTDRPTESGWYWVQGPLMGRQEAEIVYVDASKAEVNWEDGTRHLDAPPFSDAEWSGPLKPPADITST